MSRKTKKDFLTLENIEEIRDLKRGGLSILLICEMFDLTRGHVWRLTKDIRKGQMLPREDKVVKPYLPVNIERIISAQLESIV